MSIDDDSPGAKNFVERDDNRLLKPSNYFSPKTSVDLDRVVLRIEKNRTLAESGLRMVMGDASEKDTHSRHTRQSSSDLKNCEDDVHTR